MIATAAKREEPRIPFGALVEQGLLEPVAMLYSPNRRSRARMRADGTVITGDFKGLIHQTGVQVQDAPACNGWQFWCFEVEGTLAPIDRPREKLRAALIARVS